MTKKTLWLTIFAISAIVTLIGLGFSAYNHYAFNQPFINNTTKGLLTSFALCSTMVAIGLSKELKIIYERMIKLKQLKNMDFKTLIGAIIAIILAPGLVKGVYYVGVEVGKTLAGLF